MRAFWQIFAAVMLMSGTAMARSAGAPFQVTPLTSTTEPAWVTFECDPGQSAGTFLCRFNKLMLQRLPAESADTFRKRYPASRAAEQKKYYQELCAPNSPMRQSYGSPPVTPMQAAAYKKFEAACRANDPKKLAVIMTLANERTIRTCVLRASRFELTFKKSGEHLFVSDESPQGRCGLMTAATLTSDPRAKHLWTFGQKHIGLKPQGSHCEGARDLLNKPELYRPENEPVEFAGCDFFSGAPLTE